MLFMGHSERSGPYTKTRWRKAALSLREYMDGFENVGEIPITTARLLQSGSMDVENKILTLDYLDHMEKLIFVRYVQFQ